MLFTLIVVGGATYAFTCLDLQNKQVQELTDVLGAYKHLRDVNLSHNDIMDVSECQRLDYLVSLQASHNRIGSVRFFQEASTSLQYLQVRSHFDHETPFCLER